MSSIAIVGMACRYPDARNPRELWENVLAQRRAFRLIPQERMNLEDYCSTDRATEDCTYSREAAVIEGYEFDRVRFRVTGEAFRSADPAHWLALDIASQALADAGFTDGQGLSRETTGVLLANTLTGDVSRASLMRLRWPYVRRVIASALREKSWSEDALAQFLSDLENTYKAPFPTIGEESLAGGLSNTIAGRICNHFDLKGGGYTVDGACAASLLAVASACNALVNGDLDAALAGGVDLSLDPFELVGFAKAGALADREMRVYDARSQGFWPGEGCGFVVLMRLEDAVAQGRKIYSVIRGWGISSDGSGGITRPEPAGQRLALSRAYRKAGFAIDTVGYFEGHGTGTQLGDSTELSVLAEARRGAESAAPPAAIGSIKANIGHTKAAAGLAGLLKATMALHHRIIPPMTGCSQPHPIFQEQPPALRLPCAPEAWPEDGPLRAGVSAMGFGGINTHVVLEAAPKSAGHCCCTGVSPVSLGVQDAELFVFAAPDHQTLRSRIEQVHGYAARLSRADLTDLSVELERTLEAGYVRAAVVASTPAELAARLHATLALATSNERRHIDAESGVFLGAGIELPRIGFVFPGQGAPSNRGGGAMCRRFDVAAQVYARAQLPQDGDDVATQIAQPAIVTAATAALRVLADMGIEAQAAVGHSLGELCALHWAGAMDEKALLRVARARGRAMADLPGPTGEMAAIGATPAEVESLLNGADGRENARQGSRLNGGSGARIASFNTPTTTVISGDASAVATVMHRAMSRGLRATKLRVSHAFHSPLVAAASMGLSEHLFGATFLPLARTVYSTVTGSMLDRDENLPDLLVRQVTSPVRFVEAASLLAQGTDLLIEVGPGQVMSGLLREFVKTPIVALDAGGPSVAGLLQAFAAAFVLGSPVNHAKLLEGRFSRPFNLEYRPKFFVNPCEMAPQSADGASAGVKRSMPAKPRKAETQPIGAAPASSFELVRSLVAERAELPISEIRDDSRLLGDLHLNSIMVGQLVAEAAREMGLRPPVAPTEFATATVGALAQALEELARTGVASGPSKRELFPAGVDSWIRAMTIDWVEQPIAKSSKSLVANPQEGWRVLASPNHRAAEALGAALASRGIGAGVVVCLPPEMDKQAIGLLLKGAKEVLATRGSSQFILVQQQRWAEPFARTLHLEAPHVAVRVVTLPENCPDIADQVLAESASGAAFSEARYDEAGSRWEPVLRAMATCPRSAWTLDKSDVLLVTGGGKGIAAECALALARDFGVALVLLGRSEPAIDPELAANLQRFEAAGVRFRYYTADVTDAERIRAIVKQSAKDVGPVSAFLHGAGANSPKLIETLTEGDILKTMAPKVEGAKHVLDAIDPARLRLFVSFGSVIAPTGMRGEADYALANDGLARLTEAWQREHPHCRCIALEWSVWSGMGMAERLGRVEALAEQGITAISPDEGVRVLRELVSQDLSTVRVVVAGRLGEVPTLSFDTTRPPFLRFLERPQVFYSGIELVAEAALSSQSDPYLNDHVFRGEPLLPAVMGLEAMAQAATAVTHCGTGETPVLKLPQRLVFEHVSFSRPIAVPADRTVKVRVAALVREPGCADVVVRCDSTDFEADHFRAICRWMSWADAEAVRTTLDLGLLKPLSDKQVRLEADLYGRLLFHGGRFQRIIAYRRLRARECVAELSPDACGAWFGPYLPAQLVLGDPAARDAAIHAIQACIPHATILPTGVDRIEFLVDAASDCRFVHARERAHDGRHFTYDVDLIASDGRIVERWTGLHLSIIEQARSTEPWPKTLLAPFVERRVAELAPGSNVSVEVRQNGVCEPRPRAGSPALDARRQGPSTRVPTQPGAAMLHEGSDAAIRAALGAEACIHRRPDGKPESSNGQAVSTSHAANLILAVAGAAPLGCDMETVISRTSDAWRDLLGERRHSLAKRVAKESAEDENAAATRIWSAMECLKKAGAPHDAPLTLDGCEADGWVRLRSGDLVSATYVGAVRGIDHRLAIAVLAQSRAS